MNAANALTFRLMMISCYVFGVLLCYIGITGASIFESIGHTPYVAGSYTYSKFGKEWFVLLGVVSCSILQNFFGRLKLPLVCRIQNRTNKVTLWASG